MASTAPLRYNNEANTNISLNDVGNATTLAKNLGAYRGVAGIQPTGSISFSDLRGVYKTTGTQSGYYTPDNTTMLNYVTPFSGWTYQPNGYVQNDWYVTVGPNTLYTQPDIVYQPNVTIGGGQYNYGIRRYVDAVLNTSYGQILGFLMNVNYSMTIGHAARGSEQAMALGPIEIKSVNLAYTAAYADIYTGFTPNYMIGQTWDGYFLTTDSSGYYTSMRSNTRTNMIGYWVQTNGQVFLGLLNTSAFSTGAAITGTSGQTNWNFSGSYTQHVNNQLSFGMAYQFLPVSNSNNYAANGPSGGYYVVSLKDIGLRNVQIGSALRRAALQSATNSPNGGTGIANTENVYSFTR